MRTKISKPRPEHRAFLDELLGVLKKYGDKLDAVDMLAVAAHLTGQLVAMQDQRKMTPTMAMEIVAQNIEQGNAEILAELTGKSAGAA